MTLFRNARMTGHDVDDTTNDLSAANSSGNIDTHRVRTANSGSDTIQKILRDTFSKPLRWKQAQAKHKKPKTMEAPSKSKRSSKDKKSSKKSGVRTKFLIESLRNEYYDLREENDRLRNMVTSNLPHDAAESILADCFDLNAPKAKADNIDELAHKMTGAVVEEDDEDDGDY
jgi:hypothetical protein